MEKVSKSKDKDEGEYKTFKNRNIPLKHTYLPISKDFNSIGVKFTEQGLFD